MSPYSPGEGRRERMVPAAARLTSDSGSADSAAGDHPTGRSENRSPSSVAPQIDRSGTLPGSTRRGAENEHTRGEQDR